MAYVVSVTPASPGSSASFVADLAPTETGDLVLILATFRNTGSITIAGYTSVATKQVNDSISSEWFVKIASGVEASPTVAIAAAASSASAIAYVIRGADVSGTALNAIDGSNFVAGATGATCLSPALTTATANCLLIHGYAWDFSSAIVSPADMNLLAQATQAGSGSSYKATAGAISTFTYTANTSTNAGLSWVIAVKNAAGGALPVRLADGRKVLTLVGGFSTLTTAAPNANPPNVTSIGGINTGTALATVAAGQPSTLPWPFTGISIASAENLGAEAWVGAWVNCTSANISGKSMVVPYGFAGTVDNTRVGQQGLIVVFADASGNWAAYQLAQQSKWSPNGDGAVTIKPGTTTTFAASASAVDFTAITKVGYFYHRKSGTTTTVTVYYYLIFYEDSPCVIVGGGSGVGQITTLRESLYLLGGNTYKKSASFQGAGQLVNNISLQYGDGTNLTHVKHEAQTYGVPSVLDTSWRTGINGANVIIYGSASDVFDFSASAFANDQRQSFTIHASSSTSATYNFNGCSIVGWDVTWKTGVPCIGATFASCGPVNFKGASISNTTVKSTLATASEAAASWDANGATVATSTIDVTGTAAGYHISLGASVTAITLNGVTLTGTPGTDKIYSALASGTLTITADGTGTALVAGDVTFIGGSTAVASIVSPTVERGIAFTGLQTGTSIQVFTSGTQTKLFGDNSTAGSTFAFDDATSGSITVDYTIQKAGYFPQRVVGQVLTGSVGGQLDVAVTQVLDRAYVASSGLTYGTNTVVTVGATPTVIPGTKTFTQSIATTPQNWYSFWIEQWIDLGNATGEALANVAFPLSPNGPNSFTLGDGWTFSDGATSIAFFSRDGLRYLNTSGVLQKAWAAILTSGAQAGSQVRYQQSDGGTTVNAANTGEMDQLVQIYDVAGADNRGYLVLKVQREGYDQAESNVVTLYGNLEDQLYVVGLTPTANGIATGDPALTITITQGTYVVDGKTFSVKIVDNATPSTGTDLLRELRYNFALGGAYQGEDAFNWHDLIQVNGSKFKTVRGTVYGTATTKGALVYRNDGTTLHPDFDLFTADNGSTYAPPVIAPIIWAGALNATTCLLYNDSDAGAIIDTQVISGAGGYSLSVTLPSVAVAVGDSLRLRFGNKAYYVGELQGTMTATGLSFVGSMTLHPIYAAWGLNGSTYDQASGGPYTMDGPNLQVDIATGATTGLKTQLGAWTQHLMTLPAGLDAFYGAWDLLAVNQIRQNVGVVNVKIDVPTAGALFTFTDHDVNYYRSDFTFPGNVEAGHGLIAMTYNASIFVPEPVVISGSSVVTGTAAEIIAAIPVATDNAAAVRTNLTAELGRIDVAISTRLAAAGYTAPPSAVTNAAAVLAAAEITPIHSDIRKAVGQSYHGDGSEANKLRSTLVP